MPDVRLIDANALIKGFEDAGLGDHSLIESVLAAGVYAGIENAPTIDAVPVVRCEHCKEAVECQLYGEHCGLPAEKGIFCEVWQTVVDKNGYCYQGAKMDGGAEG